MGLGQTYWGEHFFFNKKIEDEQYLFSNKLKIELVNFSKIGKDSILGEINVDLISIYREPYHSILHMWGGFSNYKNNVEKVIGFVKFSVSLLGKKDEPVILEKEKYLTKRRKGSKLETHIGKKGDKGANLLLAPQIKMKHYQFKISLIKAEELMKLDMFVGWIDPYVTVTYGNASISTEFISNNKNPVFGKLIYVLKEYIVFNFELVTLFGTNYK